MINFLAMALYSSMKISMYFFHVTLCQLSMSTLLWNYTTTDLWSCYWTCSFIIKCHYNIITTTCRFSISTKSQLARSCLYLQTYLLIYLCASFFALSLLRQLEIHIGPTFLTPPSRPTYSTHAPLAGANITGSLKGTPSYLIDSFQISMNRCKVDVKISSAIACNGVKKEEPGESKEGNASASSIRDGTCDAIPGIADWYQHTTRTKRWGRDVMQMQSWIYSCRGWACMSEVDLCMPSSSRRCSEEWRERISSSYESNDAGLCGGLSRPRQARVGNITLFDDRDKLHSQRTQWWCSMERFVCEIFSICERWGLSLSQWNRASPGCLENNRTAKRRRAYAGQILQKSCTLLLLG